MKEFNCHAFCYCSTYMYLFIFILGHRVLLYLYSPLVASLVLFSLEVFSIIVIM